MHFHDLQNRHVLESILLKKNTISIEKCKIIFNLFIHRMQLEGEK